VGAHDYHDAGFRGIQAESNRRSPAKNIDRDLFIIAVNCGQAASTCFCVSMQTGPKASCGYDLVLTEVLEKKNHYFLAETGTEAGAEILRRVPRQGAKKEEQEAAERVVTKTATQMSRTLDCTDIKDLLYNNYEHPRWEDVAKRCLSCANCTMVCPTCFCTTVEDTTDLTGNNAERWRKWDSCFTMDFSYIHRYFPCLYYILKNHREVLHGAF